MRFLRFSYIVPRVILLLLLYLVAEVGSGYMLRSALISSGETAVGAKVEISQVKTSLLETRLLIRDLAVANPNSPMKNMVQAERIEIDFDSYALLRKKLIADYGIVSGMQFSTPRETSGELPASNETEKDKSAAPDWVTPIAKDYAENWFADLETRFTGDAREQLESIRLAEELSERWPAKYKQLAESAAAIKANAKQLETQVQDAKKNPLRHVEFLSQLPAKTTELRRSLRDLQAEVATLPSQIEADRAAVLAARKHDEQLIREQLAVDSIDAKQLTNYLLGEQIMGPVEDVVSWVRWAREFVPPRGAVQPAEPKRGTDVFFAGTQQLPDMLVKAMRLEGHARMGGQPIELVGVVRDWTNQPELHAVPTTVELSTTGGLPIAVNGTLDRTDTTPRDTIFVEASDLLMPSAELGKQGKLQLAVAASRANVTMNVKLVGDEIEGDVDIVQQGIAITPNIAPNVLGGRLQPVLAASLSRIDRSNTRVVLGGTLDSPKVDFESSLGDELAVAINRAAGEVARAEGERLLAKGQQQVDEKLAKLTGDFENFQSLLAGDLAGPGEIIASLLGQRDDENQIGRSPFGGFFK